MALQRQLSSAQKYRFRHWRTLSEGSVLQFKQALSAGFPVYTGVLVTSDWDDDDVHRTGVIPVPKLFWLIRIMAPPRGLVEDIMAENGIDPESDEAGAIKNQIAGRLIQDTFRYLCTAVFGCNLAVCDLEENEYGVDFVVRLEKMRGGHALCLAGYVDDSSYPGGGYFIARNSWSDTEWAPESPEMPVHHGLWTRRRCYVRIPRHWGYDKRRDAAVRRRECSLGFNGLRRGRESLWCHRATVGAGDVFVACSFGWTRNWGWFVCGTGPHDAISRRTSPSRCVWYVAD